MSERSDIQWKLLTGMASGVMGLYLGMDILYKRLKGQQDEQLELENKETEDEGKEVKTYSQHLYNSKLFNMKIDISQQKVDASHQIFRVVLTGGPCGGKTTAMKLLKERYQKQGFRVVLAPELPTITMQGGGMIVMGKLTTDQILSFQSTLMAMQIKLEDYYVEIAKLKNKDQKEKQPTIVFFDRGVCDPRAYQSNETWQAIMDQQGWNEVMLRDTRYDAVIHLVTAANGAEAFYSGENNEARYETVDMAVAVDYKLQESWMGHPHHIVIGNGQGGFQEKLNKIYQAVDLITGVVSQQQTQPPKQRKFLVNITDLPNQDIAFKSYHVEEVYLHSTTPDELVKIRKRGNNQKYSYVKETKAKDQVVGRKVDISARQYSQLLQDRDPSLNIVKKRRSTFVYSTNSYIIDTFNHLGKEINLMRIEALDPNTPLSNILIPPFIQIDTEVTNDPTYTTLSLATTHSP